MHHYSDRILLHSLFQARADARGSLRRQLENARKWATDRGLVLDDSLRDLGVSAYRGKNRLEGALAKFLALVDDGKIARDSFLIVESLDRISRERVRETLPRFMDLINSGIMIVTLTNDRNTLPSVSTKTTCPFS